MTSIAPNISRFRVVIAGLLFLVSVINYLDRAALGVVAPFVAKALSLSPSQLGWIFSTFFAGYAVFAFIGGQLADRLGPHRVFLWAVSAWSIFCALTGVVTGFVQLLIVRTLFGVAEGPITALTNRMITNWFPRQEISRAIGTAMSGLMIGGAVAAPTVGFLALNYGWRTAFFIVGALGLLWTLLWRALATDQPRNNYHVSSAEAEYIALGRSEPSRLGHSMSLSHHLLRPDVIALGMGLFAMNYTVFVLLSWLPSFLSEALHLSFKQTVWTAALPWVGGFVGFVSGGWIADRIYVRFTNRLLARKLTSIIPLSLAALALLAVSVSTNAVSAVSLISITLALLMAAMQSLWATLHELTPSSHVGAVSGFVHLLSNIAGIVGPALTGYTVQYFGGYGSAFKIAALLAVLGAVAMAALINSKRNLLVAGHP